MVLIKSGKNERRPVHQIMYQLLLFITCFHCHDVLSMALLTNRQTYSIVPGASKPAQNDCQAYEKMEIKEYVIPLSKPIPVFNRSLIAKVSANQSLTS